MKMWRNNSPLQKWNILKYCTLRVESFFFFFNHFGDCGSSNSACLCPPHDPRSQSPQGAILLKRGHAMYTFQWNCRGTTLLPPIWVQTIFICNGVCWINHHHTFIENKNVRRREKKEDDKNNLKNRREHKILWYFKLYFIHDVEEVKC